MKNVNKTFTGSRLITQQGVVLFIALIALVVMSLAAVALIRSVDTSTLVAGNLASKQSAVASGDSGMETALTWMGAVASPATFEANNAAQGYYSTQTLDPATLAWTSADSRIATGTNITAGKDASGNSMRYVIQRMCRNAGAPADGNCLFGAPSVGTSSQGDKDITQSGAIVTVDKSPVYRITTRVVGPKNTISFVQAFVY